jgi:hypothetical protein
MCVTQIYIASRSVAEVDTQNILSVGEQTQ